MEKQGGPSKKMMEPTEVASSGSETPVKDCMSCKIIGVSTFTGIGLYALNLRHSTPIADKRQRVFLACFAVSAFGVASLRMFV